MYRYTVVHREREGEGERERERERDREREREKERVEREWDKNNIQQMNIHQPNTILLYSTLRNINNLHRFLLPLGT